MVAALLTILNQAKTFSFRQLAQIRQRDGLYLLFEAGETGPSGLQRVVHIGANESPGRLVERLRDFYPREDHSKSILRKHIGRALLSKQGNYDYLPVWKAKKTDARYNPALEGRLEREISRIGESFRFVLLAAPDAERRKALKRNLLSTLAFAAENAPGPGWLGHHHDDANISQSGLWNLQEIRGGSLSPADLPQIDRQLIKAS